MGYLWSFYKLISYLLWELLKQSHFHPWYLISDKVDMRNHSHISIPTIEKRPLNSTARWHSLEVCIAYCSYLPPVVALICLKLTLGRNPWEVETKRLMQLKLNILWLITEEIHVGPLIHFWTCPYRLICHSLPVKHCCWYDVIIIMFTLNWFSFGSQMLCVFFLLLPKSYLLPKGKFLRCFFIPQCLILCWQWRESSVLIHCSSVS